MNRSCCCVAQRAYSKLLQHGRGTAQEVPCETWTGAGQGRARQHGVAALRALRFPAAKNDARYMANEATTVRTS